MQSHNISILPLLLHCHHCLVYKLCICICWFHLITFHFQNIRSGVGVGTLVGVAVGFRCVAVGAAFVACDVDGAAVFGFVCGFEGVTAFTALTVTFTFPITFVFFLLFLFYRNYCITPFSFAVTTPDLLTEATAFLLLLNVYFAFYFSGNCNSFFFFPTFNDIFGLF